MSAFFSLYPSGEKKLLLGGLIEWKAENLKFCLPRHLFMCEVISLLQYLVLLFDIRAL